MPGSLRSMFLPFFALAALAGCEQTVVSGGSGGGSDPAPPLDLEVRYYAGAVDVSWLLDPRWAGEPFRVYSRRVGQSDWNLIAEVTSCTDGLCTYRDTNIEALRSYEYFVSAVNPSTGAETASEFALEVHVPDQVPPPIPDNMTVVALDDALFLTWGSTARQADDFQFYRVYLEGGEGDVLLLGETDSEGFIDLLVENGNTYGYFVTSVDTQGHESEGSVLAEGTPRPDYMGEFLIAFGDDPSRSGFRFQEDGAMNPVLSGTDPSRDFRLEVDSDGWWLVPRSGIQVHASAIPTTALRCGPASDSGCVDVSVAPDSGWAEVDMSLQPGFSYVLRVPSQGGQWQYGVIRVSHVGDTQEGGIAVFDWAFQLQPGNPALDPVPGTISSP